MPDLPRQSRSDDGVVTNPERAVGAGTTRETTPAEAGSPVRLEPPHRVEAGADPAASALRDPSVPGGNDDGGSAPSAVPERLQSDVAHSIRNAVKLGTSLLATWIVALGVRILLPRMLGPAAFGTFQFADAFTITVFVLMSLGVETYIHKEVATRVEHASDFFGGTLLARIAIGAVVVVAALWGLAATGKSVEVQRLVLVLGLARMLFNLNATYAALLHSTGTVDGLSRLNVVSKLVWGVGIVGALLLHGGLLSIAMAVLVSEMVRTVVLIVLSRRHLRLRYTVHWGATMAVVVASVPYYLMGLAQVVYARLDVSIMSYLTNDVEVGWYGAAANIAGVSLLLAPLISWVLLPLTSRAASRSEAELTEVSRRAMELILCLALPVSLFLYLTSGLIVRTLFGAAYEPATRSLEILAPLFVLTYATMVSGTMLIRLERGWAVSCVSMAGAVVSPLLNLWLIPHGRAAFGPGGAGIGAATALIITEFGTAVAMTWLLGGRAFDRRSAVAMAKTCAVCVLVIAIDRVTRSLGDARLVLEVVLYLVLVVAWGALDLRGMIQFVRDTLMRRAAPRAEVA
jgi:O-antigen/teichoic acid export membrane protein